MLDFFLYGQHEEKGVEDEVKSTEFSLLEQYAFFILHHLLKA